MQTDTDIFKEQMSYITAQLKACDTALHRIGIQIFLKGVYWLFQVDIDILKVNIIPASRLAELSILYSLISWRLKIEFISADALDLLKYGIGQGTVDLCPVLISVNARLQSDRLIAAVPGQLQILAQHIIHRPEINRGIFPVIQIEGHQVISHLPFHIPHKDVLAVAVDMKAVRKALLKCNILCNKILRIPDLHCKARRVYKGQIFQGKIFYISEKHTSGYAEKASIFIIHTALPIAHALLPGFLPDTASYGNIAVLRLPYRPVASILCIGIAKH